MSLNPFPSIKRGIMAFVGWVNSAFCALLNPEGRRAWAVIIAWGCGVVMTAYSTYALWLVKSKPGYVFWLGTEAMGIIFIVISAITGLLVKQNIGGYVSKTGAGGYINQRGEAPDLTMPPPAEPPASPMPTTPIPPATPPSTPMR